MIKINKQTVVPYVGIDRIVEVLGATYKKGTKEITISELASLLGCGVSNINNVTPTLSLLGLSDRGKGLISITNDGMEFIRSHNSNETERAKQIIRKGIEQSEVLKFVKSLLETRVQLTGEEIGRTLSDRFEKKWKNVVSYRTFGNSCASILGFAGFGYYHDGILSLKPVTVKAEAELYAPEIGYQPIIRLLNILHPLEKAKGSDLAKKLKAKEGRIGAELSVCVTLGLIEKDATGYYRITESGRKLIDPHLSQEAKVQVFQESLLDSPYVEIITKLSQMDRELTYEDIGESLAYDLRRDWTSLTKNIYGKKFITWLNAAGLIEKSGPNNFRLKTAEIKEAMKTKEKTKTQTAETSQIYEIGRVLGALETLTPMEETRKEFEDRISVLKSLLKEHMDLDLVFDLLRKNFQLSLEMRNTSIYRINIELVRDKIKEKLGIPS
jgi:hypothetical protein